jgi:hypothetical protein
VLITQRFRGAIPLNNRFKRFKAFIQKLLLLGERLEFFGQPTNGFPNIPNLLTKRQWLCIHGLGLLSTKMRNYTPGMFSLEEK